MEHCAECGVFIGKSGSRSPLCPNCDSEAKTEAKEREVPELQARIRKLEQQVERKTAWIESMQENIKELEYAYDRCDPSTRSLKQGQHLKNLRAENKRLLELKELVDDMWCNGMFVPTKNSKDKTTATIKIEYVDLIANILDDLDEVLDTKE